MDISSKVKAVTNLFKIHPIAQVIIRLRTTGFSFILHVTPLKTLIILALVSLKDSIQFCN